MDSTCLPDVMNDPAFDKLPSGLVSELLYFVVKRMCDMSLRPSHITQQDPGHLSNYALREACERNSGNPCGSRQELEARYLAHLQARQI